MTKRVIHINQHVIRANKLTGADDPPITIKSVFGNQKAFEVQINGPCTLVYRPNKPLKCGARVWIETRGTIHPILERQAS